MFRIKILAHLMLASTLLTTALADMATARDAYVLIGINDYSQSQGSLQDLKYCVADASGLKDVLVDSGVPEKDIFLIVDGAEYANRRPTYDNIIQVISDLREELTAEDSLFVLFSGHGVTITTNADGGAVEGHLCLSDFQIQEQSEGGHVVLPNTSLPVDVFVEYLAELPTAKRIVVLDACRNFLWKDSNEAQVVERLNLGQFLPKIDVQNGEENGFVFMSSCMTGEISREDEATEHGLFAGAMIKGLQGHADYMRGNRNGQVSLFELFNFCREEVAQAVEESGKGSQQPLLVGGLTSDFAMVSLKNEQVTQLQLEYSNNNSPWEYVSSQVLLARQEYRLAVSALATGNIEEVIARCDTALESHPEYEDAIRLRGNAWLILGEFRQGLSDLSKFENEMVYVNVTSDNARLIRQNDWKKGSDNIFRLVSLGPSLQRGERLRIDRISNSQNFVGYNQLVHITERIRVNGVREEIDAWIQQEHLRPETVERQFKRIQEFQYSHDLAVTQGEAAIRSQQLIGATNYARSADSAGVDRAMMTVNNTIDFVNAIRSRNIQGIIGAALQFGNGARAERARDVYNKIQRGMNIGRGYY